LHTIKTKVTFRSKNKSPRVSLFLLRCPSTMTSFPNSQALTLQRILFSNRDMPVLQLASCTHTFIPLSFFIHISYFKFHYAHVHLFKHQSKHQTHQSIYIFKYPQVSLVFKIVQKQCKKFQKLNCLQPQ